MTGERILQTSLEQLRFVGVTDNDFDEKQEIAFALNRMSGFVKEKKL